MNKSQLLYDYLFSVLSTLKPDNQILDKNPSFIIDIGDENKDYTSSGSRKYYTGGTFDVRITNTFKLEKKVKSIREIVFEKIEAIDVFLTNLEVFRLSDSNNTYSLQLMIKSIKHFIDDGETEGGIIFECNVYYNIYQLI